MAKPLPERPRRNLTIVGLSPASLETLREIGRVVPADFRGTVFVISDAGKGHLSRGNTAGRHQEKASALPGSCFSIAGSISLAFALSGSRSSVKPRLRAM